MNVSDVTAGSKHGADKHLSGKRRRRNNRWKMSR